VNVTAFTTTISRRNNYSRQNTFAVRPLFLSADDGFINGDNPLKMEDTAVQTTTTIAVEENVSPSSDTVVEDKTKRINVTIRYTGNAGLRPFFLTVAKYIKTSNPDVIIERNILPSVEGSEDATTFEVIVDGKIIVGKDKMKRQNIAASSSSSSSNTDESSSSSTSTNGNNNGASSDSNYLANGMSVFISMHEISSAISKARKKRRPNTMYLSDEDYVLGKDTSPRAMKLEMLKRSQESKGQRPLEQ